jgi:hypothetical protein
MNLYKLTFENKTTAYRLAETEKQLINKQKQTESLGFVVDKIKLITENVRTQ